MQDLVSLGFGCLVHCLQRKVMGGRQQIKANPLPVISSGTVGVEFEGFAVIHPPMAWHIGILQACSSFIPPAGPVLPPSLPFSRV